MISVCGNRKSLPACLRGGFAFLQLCFFGKRGDPFAQAREEQLCGA